MFILITSYEKTREAEVPVLLINKFIFYLFHHLSTNSFKIFRVEIKNVNESNQSFSVHLKFYVISEVFSWCVQNYLNLNWSKVFFIN